MISIVTTMYYSAPYLKEFYTRVNETVKQITNDYEIIFVNDGSPDNSLDIVLGLQNIDAKIKIIDLSRNFAHQRAIMVGLKHAAGDYIFLIDCDLEEKPEYLLQFWEEIKKSNNIDVIYGFQNKRKGGYFEKFSGYLFFKIFNTISDVKIQPNVSTVRLMTKRYKNALLLHPEYSIYIDGLFEITGFNQKPFAIHKNSKGKTTYTLSKKIKMFIDAITSFSAFPLRLMLYVGFLISFITFLSIIYTLAKKMIYGSAIQSGWTSLILSIWFLCGMIIMFMGVMGVYLSKIYLEVKKRPLGIIKNTYPKTK